ncbi:c-type lectin domain-containing protein [Trichonephila clavata]|uniref:C-type lectin domain-containing protein n=1 Tax=Trichonephila clavata TaxID=2740835 RepID=A0A8X6H427_TRICU|nr:c-type lectin domain-containing protein [Trichonephila clavata]
MLPRINVIKICNASVDICERIVSLFCVDWFPGWEKFDWYSVQPSDDGLSEQNCVELRNVFKYPSKGQGITDTFYWNDRDCLVTNPFVCQRLKPGGKY